VEGPYVVPVAPEIRVPALHEPVPVVEEYHCRLYGVVPPEGFAVRVATWPTSKVGALGVTPPAVNAALTVTEVAGDG